MCHVTCVSRKIAWRNLRSEHQSTPPNIMPGSLQVVLQRFLAGGLHQCRHVAHTTRAFEKGARADDELPWKPAARKPGVGEILSLGLWRRGYEGFQPAHQPRLVGTRTEAGFGRRPRTVTCREQRRLHAGCLRDARGSLEALEQMAEG